MGQLKKRQRVILAAIQNLGGATEPVTTSQIAIATDMNVNGVSQTLGRMENVRCVGGKGGNTKWQLATQTG